MYSTDNMALGIYAKQTGKMKPSKIIGMGTRLQYENETRDWWFCRKRKAKVD